MNQTATEHKFEITLGPFGQRLVTIFTQISFIFPVEDEKSFSKIQHTLERGLDPLSTSFPWVAGQVICEGASSSNTGTFKMVPFEQRLRLTIRDRRNDEPGMSMEKLRSMGFPMASLDELLVAPRNTSSGRPGETIAEVFQLQATFIKGGLIFTFLGQHQALDGVGLGQVIHLFSKACRNESFSPKEIEICNFPAQDNIRLYGADWQPGQELEHNIVKEHLSDPGPGRLRSKIPAEPGIWRHFNITAQACSKLKALASKSLPLGTPYISSDDAISAFMWQSISRVRGSNIDKSEQVHFARAVDLRRYLGISPNHPGFVQSMTYHSFSADEVVNAPLGTLASDLRKAVDPKTSDLEHHGRSFATLISRTPDKTRTSYLAGFDMSKDVMLSSWSNHNSYKLDFGLGLGLPEAVRRPHFSSFPGLVYLMPKARDGDVGVAVCLSASVMNSLVQDKSFSSYVHYVG